jgi:hypothetical protein
MTTTPNNSPESVWLGRWWFPAAAMFLVLVYLPTLGTRFDFIDDGNLVYPEKPMPLGERLTHTWAKIVANYQHLGPFRPTLWAHWELAAEAFQGSEFLWRLARFVWCALAAGMLLWLLVELGLPRPAALVAAAIAMWNPYRNEVWTSLTLAEGVAMPYALFALVCARRALTSSRAWAWDIAGAAAVLMALGCKNTFAALVPAQIFLRLAPDGLSLREGFARHWRRALLLGLTLLAPVAHYVYFKLNWHPGQYTVAGPSLVQFGRLVRMLLGGVGIDFLGPGIALALLALLIHARSGLAGADQSTSVGLGRYRAALLAGLLLVGAGTAVYLPMDAISGRYTMPAVWGLDMLLAVLVAGLLDRAATRLARVALVVLVAGLVVVFAACVDRQFKFQARSRLLWQALETVEREVPHGAAVAWICGGPVRNELVDEEGIHFAWHLAGRGRDDLHFILVDREGKPLSRVEMPAAPVEPAYCLAASADDVPQGWRIRRLVAVTWRDRHFECWLGQNPVAVAYDLNGAFPERNSR